MIFNFVKMIYICPHLKLARAFYPKASQLLSKFYRWFTKKVGFLCEPVQHDLNNAFTLPFFKVVKVQIIDKFHGVLLISL